VARVPLCRSRPPLITGQAPHYEAADGLPASSRPASCRATSTGPPVGHSRQSFGY